MEQKLEQLWQLAKANKVQQKEGEFKELVRLLIQSNNLDTCLEIGAYDGGFSVVFKDIFKKVISIDLEHKQKIDGIIQITGNSRENYIFAEVLNHTNINKVDFLMIDGDHTYSGAKNDFKIYSQFVKPGGIVAFHDIIDSESHRRQGCFVHEAWNEIKQDFKHKSIICEHYSWGGIGVLWL